MVVDIDTDFCAHGFAFLRAKFEAGAAITCFHPHVAWYGTCTAASHTRTCGARFHRHRFKVPSRLAAAVVANATPAAAATFAATVDDTEDILAFGVGARAHGTRKVWARHLRRTIAKGAHVNASTLRAAFEHELLGRADVGIAADGNIDDAQWCEQYTRWLRGDALMAEGHHHRVAQAAHAALANLPPEIRAIIIALAFAAPPSHI